MRRLTLLAEHKECSAAFSFKCVCFIDRSILFQNKKEEVGNTGRAMMVQYFPSQNAGVKLWKTPMAGKYAVCELYSLWEMWG